MCIRDSIREIPANTVMVCCIGSIGKMGISKQICATNQQINSIIPAEDISPLYLLYVLDFFKKRLLARAASTVVPILNKTEFGLIKLPLPSLEQRLFLVKRIDALENTRRIIQLKLSVSRNLKVYLINQIF